MATRTTTYLQMPYNEGGDTGFREHYVDAMEKIDGIFHFPESIKYPAVMQATFESSFFTPNSSRFELRPNMSRYLQLGNLIFFEVALDSKIDFKPTGNGDITNQIVGTITPAFGRARGFFVTAINGTAAHYGLAENSAGQTEIRLASFGGMSLGKTVPKGTYFGIGGHFMITN